MKRMSNIPRLIVLLALPAGMQDLEEKDRCQRRITFDQFPHSFCSKNCKYGRANLNIDTVYRFSFLLAMRTVQ